MRRIAAKKGVTQTVYTGHDENTNTEVNVCGTGQHCGRLKVVTHEAPQKPLNIIC